MEPRKTLYSLPWEFGTTNTSILFGATILKVGFAIRFYSVKLIAFLAFKLLLITVLPVIMLLDSCEVSESTWRIMVDARGLRTNIHLPPYLFVRLLFQVKWKVVSSPVKLEILLSLKSFFAYFTLEPVRRHYLLGSQGYHFSIWTLWITTTNSISQETMIYK